MEGQQLCEVRTSKRRLKSIYQSLGSYLRKLHSVKGDGVGGELKNGRLVGSRHGRSRVVKEVNHSIELL